MGATVYSKCYLGGGGRKCPVFLPSAVEALEPLFLLIFQNFDKIFVSHLVPWYIYMSKVITCCQT